MLLKEAPVALQLYTVRDSVSEDLLEAIKKVAQKGYNGVEFAGFGGLKASDIKEHLDHYGVTAVGSHTEPGELKNNLDEIIEYHIMLGARYIICALSECSSAEEYKKLADCFNLIGKECKKNGLQFCYHNHWHEFKMFDGRYGLDIIYEETDPELVKAEIDTCWVYKGGADPVKYIEKYSGRCPLIHLKDTDEKNELTLEVGAGIMNMADIIRASLAAGATWLIVEQDHCQKPPMESIEISLRNIRKIMQSLKRQR